MQHDGKESTQGCAILGLRIDTPHADMLARGFRIVGSQTKEPFRAATQVVKRVVKTTVAHGERAETLRKRQKHVKLNVPTLRKRRTALKNH